MIEDEKLSYLVTWYDEVSSLDRQFTLSFWPKEQSVEMTEYKSKKLFLRKLKTTDLQESDLFIGNTITLLSRQLKVLDYADEWTKEKEKHILESTFGLIKPSHMSEMGRILTDIYASGLTVGNAKQVQLTGSLAEALMTKYRGSDDFPDIISSLTSGPALALVLVGENSVETWQKVAKGSLGTKTNLQLQSMEDSEEIGESFGGVDMNGIHYSGSCEEAEREIHLFFPNKPHANPFINPTSSAKLLNSTCCVILPHAVKQRLSGEIIDAILGSGFHITALQAFHLDFGRAEEFLEIYKNVVENYSDMVKGLSSGMCVAMEISWDGGVSDTAAGELNGNNSERTSYADIVEEFRQFAGPRDPEIARKLRPNSLRARYGKYGAECGVHCTDLPEDGKLEVEYFFKVLQ
eukprot:TRINITY_DN18703_c0_g1_i2.p1 TRINITY_DN18703_c0_g1~~TRINITY_DN18703_c0_g1_i2.p1  ORF type:complete len:423 (-),score=60.85 TRINITY_DN18703_c0_g1_i2:79-1296(-)